MRHIVVLCVCLSVLGLSARMTALAAGKDPPIAVIVASDHVGAVRLSDLSQIYLRKKQFWAKGARINPVNLPAAHRLRQAFSRWVLGQTPEEMERYWNDMYFHGTSPPFVLASPEAVLRFVAQTPDAVGYVSICDVDARVKVVLVVSDTGAISEDAARLSCAH